MWEREVIGHFDRQAWCDKAGLPYDAAFDGLHWHEFVGQVLLSWSDGPLHRFLEQLEEGTSERIRKLLLGIHYIPYLPMLLDNDVDVDRADFIFRDAKETGVLYGRYDLNWLISSMVVGEANRKLVVGFDERKAPRVVEQFLIARRALYDTVYYHKTVQSAEAMMGLLLRRLKGVIVDGAADLVDGPPYVSYRKAIAGEPMEPAEILDLDDYGLWTMIGELVNTKVDKTLADLAQRIVNRDLFKAVPCDSETVKTFFNDENNTERLRAAVAAFTTGEPAFYYSHTITEIRLLKKEPEKRAFFVDISSKDRKATVATETPTFSVHVAPTTEQHWLFVPAEAREAVTKLVRNR
ncbi:MAG: HD domain-containing protein [Vulcanimicrobiaceae bacterium]